MKGRRELFTSERDITTDNIIQIIRDVISDHDSNREECNYLLNYEAGEQPLQRTKTYRADINIIDCDNVASEITKFKRSFGWGNPITLISRGTIDTGTKTESESIAMLNECYASDRIKQKTQELARFVEITGLGYTLVDINTEWEDGESYFTVNVLDPRSTFVIRSSYYADKRVMVGVTYRTDSKTGNRYFTAFTKNARYEIINLQKITNGVSKSDWIFGNRSGEINPLGKIPVIEWIRDYDRMGCFEREIPNMDALNILASDYANTVDQNTQSIWLSVDIDFAKDKDGNEQKPKSNDWIKAYSTEDGKKPDIKTLASATDYLGMLNNYTTKRALILQKCGVPCRNDNSGGSTGIAMDGATGWTQAEIDAQMQDQIKKDCKLEEIKVVLSAIKLTSAPSELKNLRFTDVEPNIKRQKNYEITTKINAFATGVSHGLDYKSLLNTINLFDDPMQVAVDSAETMQMYLDSLYNKDNVPEGGEGEVSPDKDKLNQDESDQEKNSPNMR